MSEQIWFTSDTHFFHKRMSYQWRDFASVEEMNEVLVERWNERVGEHDRIYHLGDFSFGKRDETEAIIRRLNGQKFRLRGNHDSDMGRLDYLFEEVYDYKEIKVAGQRLVLFHYPIESFHQVGHGSWHLHGHCHGNLPDTDMARMDVGVDTHDYYPWSFEEIAEYMKGRVGVPADHHNGDIE